MADPFRQIAAFSGTKTHFLRELDPLAPIHLAGGGGGPPAMEMEAGEPGRRSC
jgi:hypothetical protein